MATFQIKKKSLRTWEHWDSELGMFILSKFYFSADGTKFQIVEQGQAKRRIYDITDIEVFDIGGSAETFGSTTALSLCLEELKYPAYNLGGVFEFDPSNYDLSEFTNISGNPFAKISDIPSSMIDVTASHNKGGYNIVTNSPILVNGTGQIGDYYTLTTSGERNFGAGSLSFGIGDRIEYNGSTWFKAVSINHCVWTLATIYTVPLTGTTSETIMNNATLIPTAFLNSGSLDLVASGNRTVITAGNTIINLYINSSHSLAGATLLGTYAPGTASSSRNLYFARNMVFSATQISMSNTIGTQGDLGQTSNQRNQNFNFILKNNPYIIITYTNGQNDTTAVFEKLNIKLSN